jgi:uncharacterized SAM-binding protein YcdF (DUF218 family)
MSRPAAVVGVGLLPAMVLGAAVVDPPYREAAHGVADAALVLSGDVDYLRIRHAAALHAGGRVKLLLVTGAGVGGDSGRELAKQAQLRGVPAGAILVEERSTTTRENLLNAAPMVRERGWTRVALVTSASHMGRALRAARRTMPEIEWVPAAVPDAGPPARIYRSRLGEWVKLAGYAARGWI